MQTEVVPNIDCRIINYSLLSFISFLFDILKLSYDNFRLNGYNKPPYEKLLYDI